MYEPYPSNPDEDAREHEGPSGARAGFWRRFVASFLDGIILGIVGGIVGAILNESQDVASAIGVVIGIAYYTYLEGSSGQTFGKRALGIRVVDIGGGGPIGYGRAFIRYVGRIVSAIPLLLGYFWMLWDKDKQTWHDKFARSIVVPSAD